MFNKICQHIEIIEEYAQALLATPLATEHRQEIALGYENALRCRQTLDDVGEAINADTSDYLNHYIRNYLTPMHGYIQYLEIYEDDALSEEQRQLMANISAHIRIICAALRAMQADFGTAGYRLVEVA